MTFLYVKADRLPREANLPIASRMRIKSSLQDLFVKLPTQRLWLHLKCLRNLRNFNSDDFYQQDKPLELVGPEDRSVPCEYSGSVIYIEYLVH